MNRTRDPVSVNDVVLHRPWMGKRLGNWWMGSAAARGVSLAFFVVLIAGTIWAVLFPAPAEVPGEASPASQVPSATADAMPSPIVICPVQDPTEVLPETLVAMTFTPAWYPVGMMSAPGSPTGGPGDARRCFTRSPEGALYSVITHMAEESAGTGLPQDIADQGGANLRFTGYQWQSYTPDQAIVVVRVAVSVGAVTSQSAGIFDANWVNNDWIVTADDSPAALTAAADPIRVFTPWGAS